MANKTLLDIVTQFYGRQGLGSAPSSIVSSTDDTVIQVLALMNEGAEDFGRMPFNQRQVTITFQHVNGAAFLAMNVPVTLPGFSGFLVGTLWDAQTRLPVYGPLQPRQVTEILTLQVTAAQFNYWLQGNGLYIYPVPTNPATYNFTVTYLSSFTCAPSAGAAPASLWYSADTDVSILPDAIVLADLRWRYKKEKGMDFSLDFQRFQALCADHFNTQGASPDVDMGDPKPGDFADVVGPGLLIAAGSWNL